MRRTPKLAVVPGSSSRRCQRLYELRFRQYAKASRASDHNEAQKAHVQPGCRSGVTVPPASPCVLVRECGLRQAQKRENTCSRSKCISTHSPAPHKNLLP